MKIFQRTLLATLVVASVFGRAESAHADVLNIPASAALMYGDYLASNCTVVDGAKGISAGPFSSTCHFAFPLTVPVGHTIQQIAIVYGTGPVAGAPMVVSQVNVLDYSNAAESIPFSRILSNFVPNGTFEVTRLMAQTKFGAYPDAFIVQPNTMYQVVVHLQDGAFATGLQVTYQ